MSEFSMRRGWTLTPHAPALLPAAGLIFTSLLHFSLAGGFSACVPFLSAVHRWHELMPLRPLPAAHASPDNSTQRLI